MLLFGKRADKDWRFHAHYCSSFHTTYLGCALGQRLCPGRQGLRQFGFVPAEAVTCSLEHARIYAGGGHSVPPDHLQIGLGAGVLVVGAEAGEQGAAELANYRVGVPCPNRWRFSARTQLR
jgi:hypothetical protein